MELDANFNPLDSPRREEASVAMFVCTSGSFNRSELRCDGNFKYRDSF
jgi:hypothetical protein